MTHLRCVLDMDPERLKSQLSNICLKRLGTPDDVANATSYLVNSRYVTGQVLRVDGGML